MTAAEIDSYLAEVEEPKRSTLEQVRRSVLEVVPEAQECISYGVPGFKVQGKTVAGLAAFARHLAYLPHSGSVLPALADHLHGYQYVKGSLHFPVDTPLPPELVRLLIMTKLRELGIEPD